MTTKVAIDLAMDLYEQTRAEADRWREQYDRLVLVILAEPHKLPPFEFPPGTTANHQVFGQPVNVSVEWPKGPPRSFADAQAVREWARDQLAKHDARHPMRPHAYRKD